MDLTNIEVERVKNKLSKLQIADYLKISTQTYNNWLRGKTEIPVSSLVKLSLKYQCSIDYLIGRVNGKAG